MTTSATPHLYFGSPRALPRAASVKGRVVILDIAFAATAGGGVSYETVTRPFIEGLGDRLAAWVDHHEHARHVDYVHDSRFTLSNKATHGACPEMVTPEIVYRAGPIDSILAHVDLDGLYSAAKWILDGREPYDGADHDAHCIDTRTGTPTAVAVQIDQALRARFRDNGLKRAVVLYLLGGLRPGVHEDVIEEGAQQFRRKTAGTQALARQFVIRGHIAYVDTRGRGDFDKTDLLLHGQEQAAVSVVHDSGMVTIAARYDSGWNFVRILGLEGGMPTRVTVPESRLDEALDAINATVANPAAERP